MVNRISYIPGSLRMVQTYRPYMNIILTYFNLLSKIKPDDFPAASQTLPTNLSSLTFTAARVDIKPEREFFSSGKEADQMAIIARLDRANYEGLA